MQEKKSQSRKSRSRPCHVASPPQREPWILQEAGRRLCEGRPRPLQSAESAQARLVRLPRIGRVFEREFSHALW